MRRLPLLILTLFLIPVAVIAQNEPRGDLEKINQVITTSRTIKDYEEKQWGVKPGLFATKVPEKSISYKIFLAHNKLNLAHNYIGLDFREAILVGSPRIKELTIKFGDKDIYIRDVNLGRMEVVDLES